MSSPARRLESAPPCCEHCIHNPTAPEVVELLRRIQPWRLPKDSVVFCTLAAADAISAVMAWYKGARESVRARARRRRPRLRLCLVAHPDEIEVKVREVKVKTYRRKR